MSSITWDNADILWNNNSFTWDEVQLVRELISQGPSGDGQIADPSWTDFDDEERRKKRLIKLILKVHGKTITERKQKEIKQYKIKASDIKITVEKVLGIKLMTENIKF